MEEEAEKTQEPKEVVECWKPSSSHGMVLALSFLADGTTDLHEVNRRIELRSSGARAASQCAYLLGHPLQPSCESFFV